MRRILIISHLLYFKKMETIDSRSSLRRSLFYK